MCRPPRGGARRRRRRRCPGARPGPDTPKPPPRSPGVSATTAGLQANASRTTDMPSALVMTRVKKPSISFMTQRVASSRSSPSARRVGQEAGADLGVVVRVEGHALVLEPAAHGGVVREGSVVHDAEIAGGDEGMRVQHGHRRLGGHAGVGDGQVALPVPHPVVGAGVGGPAGVLQHAQVPARAEDADLGPLLGQGGLDPFERGLGHVEHGTGAEALHVGAARAEVEQRAADRDPVHRTSAPSEMRSVGSASESGPPGWSA